MVDVSRAQAAFPEIAGLRRLGQPSGQKEVFTGNLGQSPVVLKLIIKRAGSDDRVAREIEAVAKLGSKSVPKIIKHGTKAIDGSSIYFLIEPFVNGQTLRDVLSKRGFLPETFVLDLIESLLKVCCECEKVDLVHRDLKPENIIVGSDGKIWVIDFGIVRHLDRPSLTPTGLMGIGTPGYASPEQFRNRKIEINSRADLFSIGIVACECLTGSNPFRAPNQDALETIRRTETVDCPRIKFTWDNGGFSDFLQAICARAPSSRPQTASEALDWFYSVTRD